MDNKFICFIYLSLCVNSDEENVVSDELQVLSELVSEIEDSVMEKEIDADGGAHLFNSAPQSASKKKMNEGVIL